MNRKPATNLPHDEGLARLQAGNARFAAGEVTLPTRFRPELASGQSPFAVILGCADSRVPSEIVFDQGLGDLFVVRVAGNVVAPSLIGSVEFAVSQFDTRLVVVVGHTQCGAITATVDHLITGDRGGGANIHDILDRISPHVIDLVRDDDGSDRKTLLRRAMVANVRASISQLHHGSPLLETLVQSGAIRVVGATYDLETGIVEFLGEGG